MLEVQEALVPLLGKVMQTPPEYSALKLKGRRAYDLARAGQTVLLARAWCRSTVIDVLGYTWPLLELEIDCSKGRISVRSLVTWGKRSVVEATCRRSNALGSARSPSSRRSTRASSRRIRSGPSSRPAGRGRSPKAACHRCRPYRGGRPRANDRGAGESQALRSSAGASWLVRSGSRLVALAEPDADGRFLQPRKVLFS